MLPIILGAMLVLIVTAKLCPDAPASRLILNAFVDGPVRWLESPRPSQAIPYAIGAVVLALAVVAAPELGLIAAGVDVQLLVDLTLAMSVAVAQVGLRRIRILAHKAVRAITAPLRTSGRSPSVRPTRGDSDDSDPAFVFA